MSGNRVRIVDLALIESGACICLSNLTFLSTGKSWGDKEIAWKKYC